MIKSTFVFLKGIGPFWERRLWEADIRTWDQFLERTNPPGISAPRKRLYNDHLKEAQRHLQSGRSAYFGKLLKKREHWRLFEAYQAKALYLDIETTGGSPHEGDITVVGMYRRDTMISLVKGESLTQQRLKTEFAQSDLLVSFFGTVFDVPFLQAKFPDLPYDLPHFDLCFAARRLGFRGGLKAIEREVGISRPPDLHRLDGWAAVHLWNQWRLGDQEALQTLLRYNQADTENLVPLARYLYARMVEEFGPPFSIGNYLTPLGQSHAFPH